MRSIQFKLSASESLDFEVIRTTKLGVKLSPKKFFLAAVRKEVENLMAEVEADSDGVDI